MNKNKNIVRSKEVLEFFYRRTKSAQFGIVGKMSVRGVYRRWYITSDVQQSSEERGSMDRW